MMIDNEKRKRQLIWVTLANQATLILDTQMKDRTNFEFMSDNYARGAFYIVDVTSDKALESLT